MIYRFFSQTDAGLVRKNNEDAVLFDADVRVAVLADGMGGYNAGEVASSMACTSIHSDLGRWLREASESVRGRDVRRAMEMCVDSANLAVYNAANANAHYAGMGTTLVVGVFTGGMLYLGHIGDSRCYRWRAGVLTQITKDHSLLQEQLDAGIISVEQAAISPIKNLVTRALGVEESVLLEVNEFGVQDGDIYLLCSDGLSDMVEDASIARIISSGDMLKQLAERLVATANANGGRDNISVLLVSATDTAERKGLLARILGK
jgi:protein phosphatase